MYYRPNSKFGVTQRKKKKRKKKNMKNADKRRSESTHSPEQCNTLWYKKKKKKKKKKKNYQLYSVFILFVVRRESTYKGRSSVHSVTLNGVADDPKIAENSTK